MSRTHGRIVTAIWADREFTALNAASQHLYLAFITSPQLSYAGVIDYIPGRLTGLARDLNAAKVARAVDRLEAARFAVVDRNTAELLIRSYVRHDGILAQPNVMRATAKAARLIVSPRIRRAFDAELARLHAEAPDARGWQGLREDFPDVYPEPLDEPLPEPLPEPFLEPVGNSPSPFPLPLSTS